MKLLFGLLMIVLPSLTFAQSNYQKGYILKNNGDTVKGFINYHEWDKCPLYIDFKIDKKDNHVLQFNPRSIRSFSIDGMVTYNTYEGIISINQTNSLELKDHDTTTTKRDTIFLQQLTTGKYLTLYYHRDEIKTRFFISEKNSAPIELKYYLYYDEQNQIASSDIYKGLLSLYINKFAPQGNKLINFVRSMKYEQSDFINVVDKINNNTSAGNKKKSSRFFAGIAIADTKTKVNNTYFEGTNSDNKITPKIGLGVDIFNNPNTQQLIFRGELSLSYINPQFNYPAISGTGVQTYSFTQYTAALIPQILFNIYNKDNFKIYIDAGIGVNFSNYSNQKVVAQSPVTYTPIITENPYHFEHVWTDFPFAVGMMLNKKVEISFNYTPLYGSYSRYVFIHAGNQSMGLGIKFLLGR
jgi:hypothetical protein